MDAALPPLRWRHAVPSSDQGLRWTSAEAAPTRIAGVDAVVKAANPLHCVARPLVLKQVIPRVDQPDLQPAATKVSHRDQPPPRPHQVWIIHDRLAAPSASLDHPMSLQIRNVYCPQRIRGVGHESILGDAVREAGCRMIEPPGMSNGDCHGPAARRVRRPAASAWAVDCQCLRRGRSGSAMEDCHPARHRPRPSRPPPGPPSVRGHR